jgi:hypothetical protein
MVKPMLMVYGSSHELSDVSGAAAYIKRLEKHPDKDRYLSMGLEVQFWDEDEDNGYDMDGYDSVCEAALAAEEALEELLSVI